MNYIAVYIYFTNVCNIYTVWKQQPYSFQAGEEIILYSKHPATEEQLRFSSDLTCLPENFFLSGVVAHTCNYSTQRQDWYEYETFLGTCAVKIQVGLCHRVKKTLSQKPQGSGEELPEKVFRRADCSLTVEISYLGYFKLSKQQGSSPLWSASTTELSSSLQIMARMNNVDNLGNKRQWQLHWAQIKLNKN